MKLFIFFAIGFIIGVHVSAVAAALLIADEQCRDGVRGETNDG